MYEQVIRQFSKTLGNLDAILQKATHYAETKKFSVDNFVTQRLAPDMLAFAKQIQIASDVSKGAVATLTGKEAPKFDDSEKTIAELRERIAKTRAFLDSVKAEDFAKLTPQSKVKVPSPPGKGMLAQDALLQRAVPNFFFHIGMTYALLRQGGVEIGKKDYLGELQMFDL